MMELLALPGNSLHMFKYTSDVTIVCFFLHRVTGNFRQTSMNPKCDLIWGMSLLGIVMGHVNLHGWQVG